MIEFEADCGHTIQTADQNAGQIVKCAYCGREVEAPLFEGPEPDVLSEEVDLSALAKDASGTAVAKAITIEGPQRDAASFSPEPETAPPNVLRYFFITGYVVIGLIVCILVGRAIISETTKKGGSPPTGPLAAGVESIKLDDLPDAQELATVEEPPGSTDVVEEPTQFVPETQSEDGTETPDVFVSSEPEDEEVASSAPVRPRSGNSPWGPPRRKAKPKVSPTGTVQPEHLGNVVRTFEQKQESGESIVAGEWRPYLAGGQLHTIWQKANVQDRIAFVELLNKGIARRLIHELGDTLISDSGLEVRLALLGLLVQTGSDRVIPYIDRRLNALANDPGMDPDQANREEEALRNAKKKLAPTGKKKKRKNPWDR